MIQHLIVFLFLIVSLDANAAFSWQLDYLEASGDVNFSDDFSDGILDVAPTSQLSVFLGTVTESGGALQFSDSDGAGLSSIPLPGTLRDTVLLNSVIPDSGSGTTWTGSFIPNLSSMAALPPSSGYGIQINNAGNANFSQATLGVFSDGNGNTGVGLFSFSQLIDSAIINSTAGNIVLSLDADPANDLISGSYSTDGGGSFNSLAGVISIPGDLRAWAFGQITPATGVVYLAQGWTSSDFHVLTTHTTRSIEFDAAGNLYIEDTADDNTGQIQILKFDAASGYSSPPSVFSTYGTAYMGATGLDFDDHGSLYVSETSAGGDAGIIRRVDSATQSLVDDLMMFANHRPTGVDADKSGNVYYSGRKQSDGTWGKIFQIDSTATRTTLIDNTVATGIALDVSGNIFISTPQRTGLGLQANSIYMFSPADLLNPILIATFNQTGGELTFDASGNLYMVFQDQVSIVRLSTVWGDINGDGNVNIADVLLAAQGVLGGALSNNQLARGNVAPLVNGIPQPADPYVPLDVADLLLIAQKALGTKAF